MHSLRCAVCGQYCERGADSSVPFGNSYALEYPEPDFYCRRCIENSKECHRRWGSVPTVWIPARWHLELAEEMGFKLAGPPGAAWSRWWHHDLDPPDGHVWR